MVEVCPAYREFSYSLSRKAMLLVTLPPQSAEVILKLYSSKNT
jgi:hypothetical protein